MRWAKLILSIVLGYYTFGALTWLILQPFVKRLHLGPLDIFLLEFLGGVLGAAALVWRWFNKHGPRKTPLSHIYGSAHFASNRHVKTHLLGDVGLIIGRERIRSVASCSATTVRPTF